MPSRHRLRSALLVVAALAALAAGCGSSGEGSGYGSGGSTATPTATATTPDAPPGASAQTCEAAIADIAELRVTGAGCDAGAKVAAAWTSDPSCSAPAAGSRFSCSVDDGYRCLGAGAERGIAVSCARPGASVSFVARAG